MSFLMRLRYYQKLASTLSSEINLLNDSKWKKILKMKERMMEIKFKFPNFISKTKEKKIYIFNYKLDSWNIKSYIKNRFPGKNLVNDSYIQMITFIW